MNEELQEIVQKMIEAGESEENIALVIQNYNAENQDTLKKKDSTFDSGVADESLDSPSEEPLLDTETQTTSQDSESSTGNRRSALSKALPFIFGDDSDREQVSFTDNDYGRAFEAGVNKALANLSGIPNWWSKQMFTAFAPDEVVDFANKLNPDEREDFINKGMQNFAAGKPMGVFGDWSQSTQEKYNERAKQYRDEMEQFETSITEDLGNQNWAQAGERIAVEGVGSIPSIIQALIPYVGLASIGAGGAADKQEELEAEGEELGFRTSLNSGISGAAEAIFEGVTKKLASGMFKSFQVSGGGKEAAETLVKSLWKNLGLAPLKEGLSEAATSLVQNLSDYLVQGKEVEFEKALLEISDSFIIGAAVGKGFGVSTQVGEIISSQAKDRELKRELDQSEYDNLTEAFNQSVEADVNDVQVSISGKEYSRSKLESDLNKQVKEGLITEEDAQQALSVFDQTKDAIDKTKGVELSDTDKVKAVNLVKRKSQLENEIEGLDEGLATPKKEQIDNINEELANIVQKKAPEESKEDATRPDDVEEQQDVEPVDGEGQIVEEVEIKPVKESAPTYVPDVDPKVRKEREKSKAKLKALREKKNKRAKDIQEFKKEAVRYVKSILGTSDLNVIKKSEFNSIVQKIRDAKNPKDINELLDVLEDQVNKTVFRKSSSRIGKLLKAKLKDNQGKALISQDAIEVVSAIKNLDLVDKTYSELDELQADNIDNDSMTQAIEIARSIKYANEPTTSPQNAASFMEAAANDLDYVVGSGRLEVKELKEKDKERKKANINEARIDSSRKSREQIEIQDRIKDANRSADIDVFKDSAVEVIEDIGDLISNPEQTIEDIIDAADLDAAKEVFNTSLGEYYAASNFNKQIKARNTFLDKVHQTYRYISSDLDTLVDIVSKKMSKNFLGGYLHSKISDAVRIAEEQYMNLTRKNKSKIHDKMTEIYGQDYSGIVRKMGDLVDSVVADTSKKVNTGIFDANGNEIRLSRGNVIWLYNQYKNENLRDNFNRSGLTEPVMEKLTNEFLTDKDKQFGDWLTDTFYEEMYSQLNPVFKKLYYRNLPKINNYAGQIRYQGVDGVKSTDMLRDSGYSREGSTLFFGSAIDRVNNSRPIDTTQDVFNNLFHYTDSANRFISSAEVYRDIKEILNDDQVTENFENYNRGDIKSQINKLVDFSFGFREKRDSNPIVNFLIGAKILSSLALTPKLLVTQTISTTLWLTENTDKVLSNSFKLLFNPVKGAKLMREIFENSEYIRNRYTDADFKKIEAAYVAQNNGIGNKYRSVRLTKKLYHILFGKLALSNIMLGDALGMFTFGVPYYQHKKSEGMVKFKGDEAKAIDYAIREFNKRASKNQQSYQSNDRDIMQHTDLGKVVNMYANSPKQYHRSTFQAALQVKRALQGRQYKGTVAGNLWKIFLNHAVQGALYQWVGTAMVGLLSEDDEEGTKIKDVVWGAAFGSLSKFFILGDLAQALWDTLQGKSYGKNPTLPIFSDYSKLFKLIDQYQDAVDKEDDVKIEEVNRKIYKVLLDLSGVPASKSESLVDNYEKILNGDYDSDEEMILRLLNYSQYQIDHMDEYHKEEYDKARTKKAAETRKRRQKK